MDQQDLFEEASPPFRAPDISKTPGLAEIFELSIDAFYALIHAQMSCLPIHNEISRFAEKVLRSGSRAAASQVAFDRGDPDVAAVLKAAARVSHEIHRLLGLLRFKLVQGVYEARCAPDYYILPALGEHFRLRFGDSPWAIIDEKRSLCLSCDGAGKLELKPLVPAKEGGPPLASEPEDPIEDLWRLYHRSINNEARNNPRLQRQLIPERYRPYLPEMKKQP